MLIALNLIEVLSTSAHTQMKQLAFALPAAAGHLILATLVVKVDWRTAWGIAAAAHATALMMYIDLARVREPSYEQWGVTLALLQATQMILLARLALQPLPYGARPIRPSNNANTLHVLIAFGSKQNATTEIAELIAAVLREEGIQTDVRNAATVENVTGYDAVVLGGALYINRWHRHARSFVRRHRDVLVSRPVWLFSCGPLDNSPSRRTIQPVPSVNWAIHALRANGHITFGGRLKRHVGGPFTRAVAQRRSGDWRDTQQIQTWARNIATTLKDLASSAPSADQKVVTSPRDTPSFDHPDAP
ncbi:MAG: flavodoxin domain-containing protein [Nitriliruptoraceae bacterium]